MNLRQIRARIEALTKRTPVPSSRTDSMTTPELRHSIFGTLARAGIVVTDLREVLPDLQLMIVAELARRDAHPRFHQAMSPMKGI